MAAGKPVIATEGGALPEIVLPGETGLLVPMGNAEAMADAVCALLSDPVARGGDGFGGLAAGAGEIHDHAHRPQGRDGLRPDAAIPAIRLGPARPPTPAARG